MREYTLLRVLEEESMMGDPDGLFLSWSKCVIGLIFTVTRSSFKYSGPKLSLNIKSK